MSDAALRPFTAPRTDVVHYLRQEGNSLDLAGNRRLRETRLDEFARNAAGGLDLLRKSTLTDASDYNEVHAALSMTRTQKTVVGKDESSQKIDYGLEHDANGNLTARIRRPNSPDPKRTSLGYDALDRLVSSSVSWRCGGRRRIRGMPLTRSEWACRMRVTRHPAAAFSPKPLPITRSPRAGPRSRPVLGLARGPASCAPDETHLRRSGP